MLQLVFNYIGPYRPNICFKINQNIFQNFEIQNELNTIFVDHQKAINADLQHLIDRFLFIQSIETVRCLEENVLTSIKDANIGSIFGIGYAPWTGGAVQFINQYGIRDFVTKATELSNTCGERFAPPALLVNKAENNELF